MSSYIYKSSILGLSLALLTSCSAQRASQTRDKEVASQPVRSTMPTPPAQQPTPPKTSAPAYAIERELPVVPREFRAAWIATVANINWPSKNNLSTEQQKQEALYILNTLADAHFNAVIFQVRPASDALYKSNLEPWSYYLTGNLGTPPTPYYDPLEFWITEAHKRGMELHVWLNPYRAHHTTGGAVTSASMASKMKEDVYRLSNGMYWMDPSSDRVQNHVSAVVKDITTRYDIDAIHIDDYFYPYKEYNAGRDFPDNPTFSKYQLSGGTLSRADWRRANVNKFIKRLHEEIKSVKPFVKFGISPFGIWKPGYPAGITGSSQYDELYADAKLWLNEGWCDYFSPQLYWKEGGPQSFSSLLRWWKDENYKKIHLWPGVNTVGVKAADRTGEIAGQVQTVRRTMGEDAGVIHYSVDGILKNGAMLAALRDIYQQPALVPASPWLAKADLAAPKVDVLSRGSTVQFKMVGSFRAERTNLIVYSKYGNRWNYELLSYDGSVLSYPREKNGQQLNSLAVKYLDQANRESPAAVIDIRQD